MGGKSQSEASQILRELSAAARPDKAAFMPKFMRAFPGGYGEGDVFLGVVVPDVRSVARQHRDSRLITVEALLDDARHEMRMCGLIILVDQYKRSGDETRSGLVDLYLRKLDRVNNWDLVDLSAPPILGHWLQNRDRKVLDELLDSEQLWRQRVAVLATFTFIRGGDFADTLRFADRLLHHEHDLIHKAVGWMLREVGNREMARLEKFLRPRYGDMPRTMLRYAIEKFPEPRRKAYLQGRI